MKRICVFLFVTLMCVTLYAQMPMGSGDYAFLQVYDSDGDPTEMPGHPNKVYISVVTTNFFGILQSNCLYSEYDWATGQLQGFITFDAYRGYRNGWHIYSWYGNVIYVRENWSRIRVQMTFYNGNYCEYRRMSPDEDINDAATW